MIKTIHLCLKLDPELDLSIAEVSNDVYQKIGTPLFGSITIPKYTEDYNEPIIVRLRTLEDSASSNTITVNPFLFHIIPEYPHIDKVALTSLEGDLPVLKNLTILVDTHLYKEITSSLTEKEKLLFLKIKFKIQEKKSIIRIGDSIYPDLYRIVKTTDNLQGVIDYNITEILLVNDTESYLRKNTLHNNKNLINSELLTFQTNKILFPIKCLQSPIHSDLLVPKPELDIEDDTIMILVDYNSLLNLGISSGSFVWLFTESQEKILVKIYMLLSPNDYEENVIYCHPRIKALLANDSLVEIKLPVYEPNIPIATTVALSKVGSPGQFQKVFQNSIIIRLKHFFTTKKRIVKKGDLIPIVFDSEVNYNLNDHIELVTEQIENPNMIVWFIVDSIEKDNSQSNTLNCKNDYAIVDVIETKIVTANCKRNDNISKLNLDVDHFYDFYSAFKYDEVIFPYAKFLADTIKIKLKKENNSTPQIPGYYLIHSSTPSVGKKELVKSLAQLYSLQLIEIDCMFIQSKKEQSNSTSVNNIIGYIKGKLDNILPYIGSTIVMLSHFDELLPKNDPNQDSNASRESQIFDFSVANMLKEYSSKQKNIIFILTMNNLENISINLLSCKLFQIDIPVPDQAQRRMIFQWLLDPKQLNHLKVNDILATKDTNIKFDSLALKSAGLTPCDIKALVNNAKASAINDFLTNQNQTSKNICYISQKILAEKIENARDESSKSLGVPTIPSVTWEDVGGMDLAKSEILDTIELPLKHPELFASGVKKRSGILFYGPPGTGKTLIAKAIATNFSLNFFSVKGPELLNMYIGESEANVRRVFQNARDARPCVIFFDELDSVAPKRGIQGDSGGVMDRIVSQLLSEMDNTNSNGEGIFIIGATNRPDLLDEALLRPGRFDKLLYLGLAETHEKQIDILKALTRNFKLEDNLDLMDVAKRCSFNYSGADFYALCSDAMLFAISRVAENVDMEVKKYNSDNYPQLTIKQWFDKHCKKDDTAVSVTKADFMKSLEQLVPSVSNIELQRYLQIKSQFENAKKDS